MVHLRIVAPHDQAEAALECLRGTASVINLVHLEGVVAEPEGDLILCDVAREDASVVLADLRHIGIDASGSVAVEQPEAMISHAADEAEDAASGSPADAVIWEEVTSRTSEESTLSGTFLTFITLAMLIASVGIFLNSPILIVGAMVVGPEFGPIAGFCVAIVQRRGPLAVKSLAALAVGFPVGIAVTIAVVWTLRETGVTPAHFTSNDHGLSRSIANPDFLAFFVAFCAGVAGMLSLTTAKSGALIGVLISVTTIPAAANVAVGLVYGDAAAWHGSLEQLGLNILAINIAGIATLSVQRVFYARRRARHRARLEARGVEAGRGARR